jgi:membrane protein YqaA with SNARE-associated domain
MTSLHDSPATFTSPLPLTSLARDPVPDDPHRPAGAAGSSARTAPVRGGAPESESGAHEPQVLGPVHCPVSAPKSRFGRWLQARVDSPWATPTMCALSFTDSCISPVIPEVLLVPMAMARPERRWLYALWASLASVLGGAFGYALGALMWNNGLDQLAYAWLPGFTEEKFAQIATMYGTSAFVVVFLAGFTPLPFKLFTVTAGVCYTHVDFGTFLLAAATSRTLRFFLEIHLLHRLGMPLMDWIANKSRLMTWILLALLGVSIALRLVIPA